MLFRSQRFGYVRDGVARSMGYYSAPEDAMDSRELMAPWARLALQAALVAAEKASLKAAVKATTKARTKATAPAAVKPSKTRKNT